MKRYLLFVFQEHYPFGGLNDIHNSFDSIEEANKFITNTNLDLDLNFFHILDRIKGKPYSLNKKTKLFEQIDILELEKNTVGNEPYTN